MIIPMARIRVLGPRARLDATVHALQDRGVLHVIDAPRTDGLHRIELDAPGVRRRHHLAHALGEVERTLSELRELGADVEDHAGPPPPESRSARLSAHLAIELAELRARQRTLTDEREALRAYEPLFAELDELLGAAAAQHVAVFLLRLHGDVALDALRAALHRTLGDAHELRARTLAGGDTVLLLIAPTARAKEIEGYLAQARLERAPLPGALAQVPFDEAARRLQPRLGELTRELDAIRDRAALLARIYGDELARARRGFHDALLAYEAEDHAVASERAFVIDGWVPAREVAGVTRALAAAVGAEVVVEELARDDWRGEDAPVVLHNPALFAPFEAVTKLMPLPRYGSVDPTPFVAVFFPMLFGVIAGDVGYGAAIALVALLLRLALPRARDIAKIAGAVAAYTIVFGVLYGELFGDLGTRWFGMHPLWFDRRDAILGFLALAIALGLVHLVLGLVVAAASRWRRDKREAIGRGITAVMLVLIAVALLALFDLAPGVLARPAAIALVVALPIVVVLEGVTALFDFMTIVGHVLSYARVMALGIASVMLAVVANRMHGAFGSAAIGIAFALAFHLVNFALTLFSPTIQVLRLHYVEFFGTFFEPGGGPYRPLRHWSPGATS